VLTLGLVSDTHGAVPPAVFDALAGVDEILHAGDVGGVFVETELEQIAPVVAVGGNMDPPGSWPDERLLEREGHRILLIHDIGQVYEPSRDFMARATRARVDLVVFGHSHRPADFRIGPVRYLNPGSAGHARRAPSTVARLTLSDDVRVEHLRL
jgi:uncharacterized protein